MTLNGLREKVFEQFPPEMRFTAEDAAIIVRHREMLLSWESTIIKKHYDMLYSHAPTRQIFREGERERLEGLLSIWWRRVINGPIDDQFWNWMVYVGLAHVLRKVKNPMMIAAWGYIANNVVTGINAEEAKGTIHSDEARLLVIAFIKLGKIFTSLVGDGYLSGLAEATGTNLALLETLASQEVGTLMERVRSEL
ncbi:MAG TPA: protoglobin domain-containing protein [Blastocatellia bacterium]|nr:protoglobin domain-containing protein [Blastocatellia bacterium]HMY72797.1 protoglobin domain-containing protein [Blastocatellia bacterium]HNG28412.1 protoglobin domain-containing protein [Blastocatellia bacterium]